MPRARVGHTQANARTGRAVPRWLDASGESKCTDGGFDVTRASLTCDVQVDYLRREPVARGSLERRLEEPRLRDDHRARRPFADSGGRVQGTLRRALEADLHDLESVRERPSGHERE